MLFVLDCDPDGKISHYPAAEAYFWNKGESFLVPQINTIEPYNSKTPTSRLSTNKKRPYSP